MIEIHYKREEILKARNNDKRIMFYLRRNKLTRRELCNIPNAKSGDIDDL